MLFVEVRDALLVQLALPLNLEDCLLRYEESTKQLRPHTRKSRPRQLEKLKTWYSKS